jgi:hypothetical protein
MSNAKTKFYEPYILEGASDGWGVSHDNFILDGKVQHEAIIGDRCWGQAWWGIFIAFHEDEVLQIKYTNKYLNAIEKMLKATGNIFLRDCSDAAIKKYVEEKDTGLEASKDQIIGMMCGLYLLYNNTSHYQLKDQIKDIVKILSNNLAKHQWFLYNENEKRFYNSAYYCQVHHYGLNVALNDILGIFRPRAALEYLLYITQLGKTLVKINLEWMRDLKDRKFWWQNIEFFKKYPWYGDYFRAGMFDFAINLIFFEGVIAGNASKRNAEYLISLLDGEKVKSLLHSNLAALYIMLCRKWNLNGKSMDFYVDIYENKCEVLYPANVLPNEARIGSPWVVDQGDLWNHVCWNQEDWDARFKAKTPGNMNELIKASMGKKIVVGNGLVYTAKHYLINHFK